MFLSRESTVTALQAELQVTGKSIVADGVVSLTLSHPDGRRLPDWTPGSHIDVVLPSGAARQYSLCGDRWDSHNYRIGVLHEELGRGGSSYIHQELVHGSKVALGGPRNNFPLVPSKKYLFIAGGIGITPMIPMIHQAELVGADWRLVYLGRTRGTMAFLQDLEVYGERVLVWPKDERGRFSLDEICAAPDADTKLYACGPQGLLAELEERCAHWPPGLLRIEHFSAKAQGAPVRDTPFEVELARSRLSVTVTPDVSVVDALHQAGINVLTSCKAGTCGTCEVDVLQGQPDHRDSILSEADRESGRCMLPCVSRSCGDRLVLDL
ncbi:2Fe-2S iron-sulfur cluster-binding protein [Paenarthrobacter sp. YAF11_1]|uniref:PDR/VanB family oxidoreductase n=1 Tax=Paenarthrobacter sp. YAF11_1 TaxID=3233074 RepID=UPI003F981438